MELKDRIGEIRIAEICPSYPELLDNKYTQTILIAYYALTRLENVCEAAAHLENELVAKSIFEEFIKFLAGETIVMECTDFESQSKQFINPGSPVISAENFIQVLKNLILKAAQETQPDKEELNLNDIDLDEILDEENAEIEITLEEDSSSAASTPIVKKKSERKSTKQEYKHQDILE